MQVCNGAAQGCQPLACTRVPRMHMEVAQRVAHTVMIVIVTMVHGTQARGGAAQCCKPLACL